MTVDIEKMLAKLTIPEVKQTEAYKLGYDCGVHGANTTNCHFSIFNSKANTREWEKGKAAALLAKENEDG